MICPNCSESVLDHAKVCPFCQYRFQNLPEGGADNKKTETESKFDFEYTISSSEQSKIIKDAIDGLRVNRSNKKWYKSKNIRRMLFLGAGVIVLLSLLFGIIKLVYSLTSKENIYPTVYLKNNQLVMQYGERNVILTDNALNIQSDKQLTGSEILSLVSDNKIVKTSKEGNYTFYMENFDPQKNLGDLKVIKDDEANTKVTIASDVHNSYIISDKGNSVLFLQGADYSGNMGTLYFWKVGFKEPVRIASDMDKNTFVFSQRDREVLFLKNFNQSLQLGDLYLRNVNKKEEEKNKIDTDVCKVFGTNTSGEMFIYAKDYNALNGTYDVYIRSLDSEKKRISEQASKPPVILGESDKIYVFGNYENGMNHLYLADLSAQIKANSKTEGALKIDSGITDLLKISADEKTILYDKVYENGMSDYYIFTWGKQPQKVASNVRALNDSEHDAAPQFDISDDFSAIAYISGFDTEKEKGTLYMSKYSKGTAKVGTKVSGDVYSCNVSSGGQKVVYSKNYNVSEKTLDIYSYDGNDSALVKERIGAGLFTFVKNGDNIVYISDFNTSSNCGTLETSDFQKGVKKIDTDVSAFGVKNSNQIVYFKNLDKNTGAFDFYLFNKNGEKVTKIDSSVTGIVEN